MTRSHTFSRITHQTDDPQRKSRKRFWVSLIALGVSSVSGQLVIIREIMSSLSGNELVIGLVLGVWLLFTGIGSALGAGLPKKAKPETLLFWGHLAIATIPFFQMAAIRALPRLWVRGEMLGLSPAILSSAGILLPFCLAGGAMIPVAGALLRGNKTASRVYIADTVGDITGGLLFSLVFVFFLSHWDSLVVVGMINVVAAGTMIPRWRIPVLLLCLALLATRPLDKRTLSWRFPGQTVLLHKNTPFAQLTITKTGHQVNVLQDGRPLFSTNDLQMEAKAHLPMSQVGEKAHVLLIAGGVFGTIEEISKHQPDHIDYVELDPAILELEDQVGGGLNRPSVSVHTGDGRLFVKQTEKKYDVVIVDLPGPENAQLNRFYSRGFFKEVQSVLRPQGVLLFSLVGAENYLEEKGLALNRSVYGAVKETFNNVLVLPGTTHYYLASDGPLTTDIANILAKRGVETQQLVDYDLPGMTDPFRLDLLRRVLDEKKIPPNEDLSPRAFGDFMAMWMKKSGSPKTLLFSLVIVSMGFAGWVSRKSRIQFTIMTSGFSGMALELSIILLFQVIYGYVYSRMCLFVTLFMIGSALGALVSKRTHRQPARALIMTDLAMVLAPLAGCLAAWAGIGWRSQILLALMQHAIIPALIFAGAFTVGYQFSVASQATSGSGSEVVGRLYLADLVGAACGTILTGLVLIPRIGIIGVLIATAILKIVSLGVNVLKGSGIQGAKVSRP